MALPKHNIEKIIRDAGAERVGEDATESLTNELERIGREISQKAIRNAEHAGRKTVKEEDIRLAIENRT